jgi:hypothetical protein
MQSNIWRLEDALLFLHLALALFEATTTGINQHLSKVTRRVNRRRPVSMLVQRTNGGMEVSE